MRLGEPVEKRSDVILRHLAGVAAEDANELACGHYFLVCHLHVLCRIEKSPGNRATSAYYRGSLGHLSPPYNNSFLERKSFILLSAVSFDARRQKGFKPRSNCSVA
jgi:hypothetical protein